MSNQSTENPFAALSRHLAGIVTQCAPGVVAICGRGRPTSSGFVWRSGTVVTASDALERDEDISVLTPEGERVSATLAGRDPSTDIAVLKVPGAESPLALARADLVSTGELALAIGRHSDGPMASLGMIAIAGGAWQSLRGGRIDRLIRLDRGIDPRQEGGVLANASSLASPRGLLVVSVDPNGPGRRAGMLIGDIVTAWNGEALRNVRDVFRRLGSETVGQQISFAVIRAGKITSANVEISERPMS